MIEALAICGLALGMCVVAGLCSALPPRGRQLLGGTVLVALIGYVVIGGAFALLRATQNVEEANELDYTRDGIR